MSKSQLLLQAITKFYQEDKHSEMLLDVLQRRKGISLRNLEHFVTNYSKTNNLTYTRNGRPFTVHVAYKSSLDGYSKKLFDPFCRTERIDFEVGSEKISTTVAQLNFIRWCIVNGIIDFLVSCRSQKGSAQSTPVACSDSPCSSP